MPLVEDSLSERGTSVSFPRSWEREQWTSTEEKLNVGTFGTPQLHSSLFASFLSSLSPISCNVHPWPSSTKRHRPQPADLWRASVQQPWYLCRP
ncbi:hypothetical protein INR49_023271 [Caranx melampygus]|nr:hypothetical protein INR49_023271 [Caranx melampygus]